MTFPGVAGCERTPPARALSFHIPLKIPKWTDFNNSNCVGTVGRFVPLKHGTTEDHGTWNIGFLVIFGCFGFLRNFWDFRYFWDFLVILRLFGNFETFW